MLKNKEALSNLPYDNFLKNKSVHVAALSKRPKDRKVLLEIEKLNSKKQEREYKKYLDEQVKHFKDQRQKDKLKQVLERRKLELGIAPMISAKSRAQTRQSRRNWKSEDGRSKWVGVVMKMRPVIDRLL